jgi:hypothetical protein
MTQDSTNYGFFYIRQMNSEFFYVITPGRISQGFLSHEEALEAAKKIISPSRVLANSL